MGSIRSGGDRCIRKCPSLMKPVTTTFSHWVLVPRNMQFSGQSYLILNDSAPCKWTNWNCDYSSSFIILWASLVAQTIKNLPAVQETGFDPWVGKTLWRRAWQPTPVFLPEESQGWKSPSGCRAVHRIAQSRTRLKQLSSSSIWDYTVCLSCLYFPGMSTFPLEIYGQLLSS